MLIVLLGFLAPLPPAAQVSAETDAGDDSSEFVPQMVGDCDPNLDHPLGGGQATALSEGRVQIEPSVVFLDETFTVTYRSANGEGPWGAQTSQIPSWLGFLIDNESDAHELFDDGSNGDAVSGDGVYSRACLHLPENTLGPGEVATETMGMAVLDPSLRGTISYQQVSDKVRTTEGGYFITMGESYGERWSNGWEHVSPSLCTACFDAWNVSGHVFDFLAIQTRDSVGGAGYVRFHDPVGNIGMDPSCEHNSHCYSPLDGREHPELRGILHMQYITNGGLTHEMGHGLLGLDSGEFPESGEGAWNSGDGMHLDSDTTVAGDLSGPFWDPNRGWPYAVQIEDENGDRTEVRLVHDNGSFKIVPDDKERMVWSDIFLYIAGFLPAEQATEINFKLINETIESCVEEEYALFCTETNVTAERVIEFDTQDFIDTYGQRVPPHGGDEGQINIGVLHISDRNHTEAEMIWFTESYKEWAHSTDSEGWTYTNSDPWPVITKDLSSITIDPSQMTTRPLANSSILSSEGEPQPISGCGYPGSQYGMLTAPESPYGNETLFFSDLSMDGLCFLNEFYEWVGADDPRAGPPANASYFIGHFERTPVENTYHNVTVYQDSEGELWWQNEAGAVWGLVWDQFQEPEPEPPMEGCTDSNATNFEELAEVDDGTCEYPEPEPEPEPEADPDYMAYYFDFAAISGFTHSIIDKSDYDLSDSEFIEMALNQMHHSDEITAFVIRYWDEQQQEVSEISFKSSFATAYDKPESVYVQQLYILTADLVAVSSLGNMSENQGPIGLDFTVVPDFSMPAPSPIGWQTGCLQETELDDVGQITSFEVCAIYVEKAWAIDAIRFVYADGSYIDAGRPIEDINASKVVEWLLAPNMTFSQVDYSIHYRLPWDPHDEVGGIISSFTVHFQGDAGKGIFRLQDSGTFMYWHSQHTYPDRAMTMFPGEAIIENGTFSTTDDESWIYYVEFLNEDWSENDLTGVLIHNPKPEPSSSPLPGFGTVLAMSTLLLAAMFRNRH